MKFFSSILSQFKVKILQKENIFEFSHNLSVECSHNLGLSWSFSLFSSSFFPIYFKTCLYCHYCPTTTTVTTVTTIIVSVLWREEGYTVKYSLNPREIPRAEPDGFPEGSGYISLAFSISKQWTKCFTQVQQVKVLNNDHKDHWQNSEFPKGSAHGKLQ